jgi:hypothetical protein
MKGKKTCMNCGAWDECPRSGVCITAEDAVLSIIEESGRERASDWDISCFVLEYDLRPYVRSGVIERTPDGRRWRLATA